MNERVEFLGMKAKNYMSFASIEHNFVTGLYIVLGQNHDSDKAESNGSGKSSLVELPGFLIYGIFEREDPSTNGKGEFEGEIEWRKGGHHYRIHRFFHHKKNTNKVFLYKDSENITPVRLPDVKDKILEAIGMSYELFVHTVVILQNLMPSFTSLTPTVRKAMIEDMIGSTFYAEYKLRFTTKAKEIARDKQAVDLQVSGYQGSLIAKNAEMETSKQLMGEVIDGIKAEIAQATLELQNAQVALAALPPVSAEPLQILQRNLSAANSDYANAQTAMQQYQNTILQKICRVCGAPISAEKIAAAQAELVQWESKRVAADALAKQIAPQIAVEQQNYQAALTQQSSLQERVRNFTSAMGTASRKLAETQGKADVTVIQKAIDDLNAALDVVVGTQGRLQVNLDYASYLEKLMLPSSPFRSYIIKKYLAYINNILHEISPTIMDGVSVFVEMDSKEGVDIKMIRDNGAWISYKNLSGGEKRRMDAVFILAFQRFISEITGAGSNVLFLDEITEGVDAVGVENVVQAVSELFSGSCVYMISHSDTIKTMFDKCITAHKRGGISTLVESN